MKEKELIEKRTRLEEHALHESFTALASVLQKQKSTGSADQDPLLEACKLVGNELDIVFQEPKEGVCSVNLANRIRTLCDIAGVRSRQIALLGTWYTEDGGHCVGFFGPQSKPVALICSGKDYTMIDPETRKQQTVDAHIASQIATSAFQFYGSFPEETLSRKETMRFSIFGKKKQVALIFLMGAIVSLLNLSLPLGSKLVFGKIIPELNQKLLLQVGAALFIAAISSALYQLSQGFLIFRINTLVGNRLETALWDRLLKLPLSFFKLYTVGDLFSRINGFVTVRRAFNNFYVSLLLNALFSIFFLVVMLIFSPILTLIGVVIVGTALAIYYFCQKQISRFQKASYEIKGKLNGFIVQVIAGISKLRVSGGEKRAFTHWAKLYAEAKKNDLRSQYYQTGVETTFAVLPIFSALSVFSAVIYFVYRTQGDPALFQGILSSGEFYGFVAAFGIFSGAIISSIPAVSYLFKVLKPVWVRGAVIFQQEPEITPQKRQIYSLEGRISVEQLSFRYSPTTPYVLKNVSFHANPGEFVGIIGPSGSGKSTLVRLLLGFETPESGSVSYDGADLSHLDLRSVRRELGVVLQNGSVMAGTIYENLVCGGIYSQEQVERAIHLSAFDQDLWNFPMGLHTMLSSGGETLSGGQKQRLLIARALISNPKILIFDEATSALDNITQEQLSKNIEQLHVTRIVIAHRLSTLRQSDRIYVLHQGEIIDQGTFDELIAKPGLFARFAERQKV